MTNLIRPEWLRHDLRDLACGIAMCSLIANILPATETVVSWFPTRHRKGVQDFYIWLIDMVAFCALNWRICLPSMDFKFFGFARNIKHGVRNWQQDRADRRYNSRQR